QVAGTRARDQSIEEVASVAVCGISCETGASVLGWRISVVATRIWGALQCGQNAVPSSTDAPHR
ncbi:MAG: hypothetical protein DMG87_04780, partial [Acidobacteria bacterium]